MDELRSTGLADPAARTTSTVSLKVFLARLIWACVLPLVILASYLALRHVHTLQDQLDREAADRTHTVLSSIDRHLEAHIAAMQMLAASPFLDDQPRLDAFYREAKGLTESFGGHVILADLSTQMLLNTRVPLGSPLPKLPVPKGHAAAPKALATRKPAVGDMFMGPVAHVPLVSLVVPVLRDGETRYLLVNTFEARQFLTDLEGSAAPTEWSLSLLDSKEEVIARRSPPVAEGIPVQEVPSKRLVAKSAVSPWSVVLEIPGRVYHASNVTASVTFGVAILAVTFVCILGARLAARRLARSVSSLAHSSVTQPSRPHIAEIEAARARLDEAAAARDAAERTRQESEQRFRQLYEFAPLPLCHVSRDGVILTCNARFTQVFGYDEETVPTLSEWWQRAYPDPEYRRWVIDTWEAAVQRARNAHRDIEPITYRVTCRTGEELTVLISGTLLGEDLLATFFDVTERHRAEEALRRYEMLAAHSRDIILFVRRDDGHLLEANAAAAGAYGFTREELLSMTVHQLRAPEARGLSDTQMEAADVRGILFETVHQRSDGSTFPVEVNTRGATIDSIRTLISVVRDITDRKAAAEALMASEARLRLSLQAAKAGTWEWDLKTNDICWSDELWRLYGVEPFNFKPSFEAWRQTVHPADFQSVEEAVLKATESGTELNVEWRLSPAEGSERWLMSRGRPVTDVDGQVVRYIGIVMDISEIKEAELARRQWADAFEHCAHGVAIGRPSSGHILACNPAFARLHGVPPAEIEGRPILDVYAPSEREYVLRSIEEADRVGQVRYETLMQRKDGSTFPVQMDVVSVRDTEGSLVYRVATMQDITERKQSLDALQSSLEEKDSLLKEVHHRVKNNLQIVASLLGLQSNRLSDPHTLEVLEDTRSRVRSMALLHEVLYRSGNLARINFALYTQELCAHLLQVLGSSRPHVTIENSVGPIELPLEQSVPCGLIINELVSNALKHGFPDGRSGTILVGLAPSEENRLTLTVCDDGVGMADDRDPLHGSTLGLKLVSRLAGQLKGHLSTEKKAWGTGALFRVVFPAPEAIGTRRA